ncbi:MAG: methionine--tRNA ligase [Planctomycetota bacterium]|nr:methionine--tRNA ligase [Planctomycetota bacterium]
MSTETPTTTPAATVQESPLLPNVSFDQFAKLDLRVATIVSAELHPNADKLLKIRVDDGTPEGRQICAGIKAWYEPSSLIGRQVIIVANLEPRVLRGEVSQGMILAASAMKPTAATTASDGKPGPDERDVIVLTVEKPVPAGSKVS